MSPVIAWSAFAGAWLLVAGPVYQAALELTAEQVERDAISAAKDRVELPHMSAWWWLLPPLGYVLTRRQHRAYRVSVMSSLTRTQLEQLIRFADKANGWIFIALGAFLVAIAETWQLREIYDWPLWAYFLAVLVMLLSCAANTALRMKRSHDLLQANDEAQATAATQAITG